MARASARILFVNHTAEIEGPSHSLLMLVRHLRDRYDCAVLLPEEGPLCEMLEDEDVGYFFIPGLQKETILRIRQLVRREKFDLVYGNTPSACSRNAMMAAKLARRPFIWHIRSMRWHWTWRTAFFLRWADAVVAVSQACAEPLKRYCPPDKVNVVHNGVELSSFNGNKATARRRLAKQLGLPSKAQILVAVSKLRPLKAHEVALDVMDQLSDESPNVHLVVAGDLGTNAAYTEEIRGEIERRRLHDRVHLLGLVRNIPQLLASADVFLHTSRSEAHPRVVLEAMAARLPVVAFSVDGIVETIVDGETGYLLPFGDVRGMVKAVRAILGSPAHAAEMGKKAREHVRSHFTAARTADRVAQIIDGLIRAPSEDQVEIPTR